MKDLEDCITNISVKYHRNGIGGEGFFAINFRYTDEGEDPAYGGELIGTIPDAGEDDRTCNGRCYIVNPGRSDLCYRGDNFEPCLRECITAERIVFRQQLDESRTNSTFIPEVRRFKDMVDVRKTIGVRITPITGQRDGDRQGGDRQGESKKVTRYESIGV